MRGYQVTVLDGLHFTHPRVRPPGILAARILGSKPPKLSSLFSEAGARYELLKTPENSGFVGASPSTGERERVNLAADSSAESLRRVETRLDGPAGRLLRRRMISSAFKSMNACKRLFESSKPDMLVVLNGRQVDNVGAILAAESLEIPREYVELGVLPKTLSFKPFSVFDQASIAEDFKESRQFRNSANRSFARDWLDSRTSGLPEHNQFALSWEPGKRGFKKIETLESLQDNVVFFTSSPDEFTSLPEHFADATSWAQGVALLQTVEALKPLGVKKVSIRLHPNLARKRPIQILDALLMAKRIQRNFGTGCAVISPVASINTYELIADSRAVIGFASTVCLEAAYMEKKSILLRESYFSKIVGVPIAPSVEIFNIAMLADPNAEQMRGLKRAAIDYYAYTFFSSKPMTIPYDAVFPGFDDFPPWKRHVATLASYKGMWLLFDQLGLFLSFRLRKVVVGMLALSINLKLVK